MLRKNSELFSSILYIVIGLVLIYAPDDAINVAMTVAAIAFIISGAFEIWKRNFIEGAVSIGIGLIIFCVGWWLVLNLVLLVFGILIALKGGVALIEALRKRHTGLLDIIFPSLTILVGVGLAMGNTFGWIMLIAGIFLVVNGALGLLNEIKYLLRK